LIPLYKENEPIIAQLLDALIDDENVDLMSKIIVHLKNTRYFIYEAMIKAYKNNKPTAYLFLLRLNIVPCNSKQFEWACWNKYMDIIQEVINKSFESTNIYDKGLYVCVLEGNIALVKLILSTGKTDPSYDYNKCVNIAINKNFVEIIEMLLSDPRVDPSMNGHRCLCSAVRNQNEKLVKILLSDKRIDPSLRNYMALGVARKTRNKNIIKLLVDNKNQNINKC
jgi:ankyrin repeat protein